MPSLLDDLTLGPSIGEGGMARVYRALHRPTGTPVALKCVRSASRSERRALARELEAMAALHHPHILHLYDHGEAEDDAILPAGTAWMALELASGGSLDRDPPQSWVEVRRAALTVLDALAHAHARNLLHRDLKPANLMRMTAGDVRPGLKLADFGIARAWQAEQEGPARAGTPSYMAPEQVTGGPQGPWTDLYAFGSVLWEWVTGAPRFAGAVTTVLNAQVYRSHGRLRPAFAVPLELEELLHTLLAKEGSARPGSAAFVAEWLRGLPEPGTTERARPRGRAPVPPDWHGVAQDLTPGMLSGAGLGLLGLRELPVIGRESERDQLWHALREASRGSCEICVLTGPVGSGRTRLAQWLCERVVELGVAEVDRDRPGDAGLAGIASRLRERSGSAAEPGERARPDGVFQLVVGAATGLRVLWLDEPARDRDALRLLETFAYARPDAPLLVVATGGMDDERLADVLALPWVRRIELGPLGRIPLSALVQDVLGLTESAARQVVDRADGSPGLALAWIRSWAARDLLERTAEGLTVARSAAAERPPTPDATRREQLLDVWGGAGRARRAIAAGALLGARTRFDEWEALCASLGVAIDERFLQRLVHAGLASRDLESWGFVDPALRHVVLELVKRAGAWERWSRAAAGVLARFEPTRERSLRRARHLAACGLHGEARALAESIGGEAVEEDRWDELDAVSSILADLPEPTDELRARRLANELLVVVNAQSAQDGVDAARELLPLASTVEPATRVRIARLTALTFALAGLPAEAEQALALLPDGDPAKLRGNALVAQARRDYATERALWLEMARYGGKNEGIAHFQLAQVALRERRADLAAQHVAIAERVLVAPGQETVETAALHIQMHIADGRYDAAAAPVVALLEETRRGGSAHDLLRVARLAFLVGIAVGDVALVDRTRALSMLPCSPLEAESWAEEGVEVARVAAERGDVDAVAEAAAFVRRVCSQGASPRRVAQIDAISAARAP
ncbi:MAG: serine/threonine-protein kinase PknK [Alphaproteobacteria bacterium]|nr:serine/threonine-protein kinase PknK [Alphaproteobacteria bacterium]